MVSEIETRVRTKLEIASTLMHAFLKTRFDENEPRDGKGEWTSGGNSDASETPIEKSQTLHHVISFGSKEEQGEFLSNLKKGGGRLNADERLDVSKTKGISDANAVHLQIDGHKSGAVDQSGAHFKGGSSFKVDSVEENKDGSKTVHLHEIGAKKSDSSEKAEAAAKPENVDKISSKQAAKDMMAGKDPDLKKACVDWVSASNATPGVVGFTELNLKPNGSAAQRVRAQFDKLENYKSTEPLYRSMSFNSPEQRDAFLAKIQAGQKFPVRGMAMSTSKDEDIARTFSPITKEFGNYANNRVHIEIQDHQTGKDLEPLVDKTGINYAKALKQKEVVFLSGSKFQVISVERKDAKGGFGSVYSKTGRRVDVSRFGPVNAPWDSVSKIVLRQIQ